MGASESKEPPTVEDAEIVAVYKKWHTAWTMHTLADRDILLVFKTRANASNAERGAQEAVIDQLDELLGPSLLRQYIGTSLREMMNDARVWSVTRQAAIDVDRLLYKTLKRVQNKSEPLRMKIATKLNQILTQVETNDSTTSFKYSDRLDAHRHHVTLTRSWCGYAKAQGNNTIDAKYSKTMDAVALLAVRYAE